MYAKAVFAVFAGRDGVIANRVHKLLLVTRDGVCTAHQLLMMVVVVELMIQVD